jgi:hypothetical protein
MEQNNPVAITALNIEDFRGELTFTKGDLPYNLWSVFSRDAYDNCAPAGIVPVAKLVSRKNEVQDPKFVAGLKEDPRQTAFHRMTVAARDGSVGREPLKVRPAANGSFDVIDGNATAQVLMLVGWQEVPVQRIQIESGVGNLYLPPHT